MKPRDPRSRRAPRDAQRRRMLKQRRAFAQSFVDRYARTAQLPLRGRRVRRRAVAFTQRAMDDVGRKVAQEVTSRIEEQVANGHGLHALFDHVADVIAKVSVRLLLWLFLEGFKRRRRLRPGRNSDFEYSNEAWNPPPRWPPYPACPN